MFFILVFTSVELRMGVWSSLPPRILFLIEIKLTAATLGRSALLFIIIRNSAWRRLLRRAKKHCRLRAKPRPSELFHLWFLVNDWAVQLVLLLEDIPNTPELCEFNLASPLVRTGAGAPHLSIRCIVCHRGARPTKCLSDVGLDASPLEWLNMLAC